MLWGSPLYNLFSTGKARDPEGKERTAPLLPLYDAHLNQSLPWGPKVQMTYRSGHVLDYVWVSENVNVLGTMPIKEHVATVEPKAWPCASIPSDHIPIGAIVSWSGAPQVMKDSERTGWQQLDDVSDPWTISPSSKVCTQKDADNS
jgi:hypothetical protein